MEHTEDEHCDNGKDDLEDEQKETGEEDSEGGFHLHVQVVTALETMRRGQKSCEFECITDVITRTPLYLPLSSSFCFPQPLKQKFKSIFHRERSEMKGGGLLVDNTILTDWEGGGLVLEIDI